MAINKAIIQIRRGLKDDLQFDKLLPGELAIATDAPCMWFCWAVGEVEQIPTSDNIEEVIEEIIEKYLKDNPVAGISEIYMRVYEGYIQYSSDGETYNNLISVSELKGAKGDPGIAGVGIRTIKQTTKSSEDGGTNVITITLSNDMKATFEVLNGKKGSPGNAGVGIQSISQQTGNLNGGKNTIQIVLTNGNVQEVFTYNGKNGSDANVTLANIVKALGFTPASEEFVNNQVSTIPKFELQVVDSLPTANIKETTVYLLKSGDESDNLYTEYIYKNGKWEKLGSQTLDLSKYAEKSTTLDGYGITDGATKEEVEQLSQEIVDLEGAPKVVTSKDEMTDPNRRYVYNGYIWEYGTYEETIEKEVTREETVETKGKVSIVAGYRYSHSGQAFNELITAATIIVPITSTGTEQEHTVVLTNATIHKSYTGLYYGTTKTAFPTNGTAVSSDTNQRTFKGISAGKNYVAFMLAATGTDGEFNNAGVAVDGEEFDVVLNTPSSIEADFPSTTTVTITETITETVTKEGFYNTGVSYGSSNGMRQYIETVQAPSPQLPTDGSDTSDVNLDSCTSDDIHNLLSDVVTRYPNYITKELMGTDESGTLNIYRYTLGKHSIKAWRRANYPKMYAWINGTTVIYSESVSPRIGDNMYSTKYIGTVYGTVTAVSATNRSRTVNGIAFVRSKANDVKPTLLYHPIKYRVNTSRLYTLAQLKTMETENTWADSISSINGNTMTTTSGVTYYRYPFGDMDNEYNKRIPITIIANEHGGNSEPRDCAVICARFIKDLCEGKYLDNPVFNYIKEKTCLTVIPVVNPHGYNKYNDSTGYYNYNGVNINRNYDTVGWDVYLANNPDETAQMGEYAGSEIETQYVMNTMSESEPVVAMSVHGLSKTKSDYPWCKYQGQNPNGVYEESKIEIIREELFSRYGLKFMPYDPLLTPPESTSKSPSYITQIGAYGGLIEFNPNDVLIPTEGSVNRRHTAWTMEQQYTQFLKMLAMWISDYEENQ